MICNRVAIINQGMIIADGTLEELLTGGIEVDIRAEGINYEIRRGLETIGRIVSSKNSRIRVAVERVDDIPKLAQILISKGGRLYELTINHHSLEDLFVELVQGGEKP